MGCQGKMVSSYIHGSLCIRRELSGSVEDATTSTRSTVHLKESDSDLNRLPALAAYLLGMTPENLVIKIIEVHLNDLLVLRKVELVQVGSLLCNSQ